MVIFVCDILQLLHTVISNSERLTHPNVQYVQGNYYWDYSEYSYNVIVHATDIFFSQK